VPPRIPSGRLKKRTGLTFCDFHFARHWPSEMQKNLCWTDINTNLHQKCVFQKDASHGSGKHISAKGLQQKSKTQTCTRKSFFYLRFWAPRNFASRPSLVQF